ncbi:alpha/beta hydrolase-fold protein [Streptomyces sp. NPDC048191]|uniref:alpha/beta hydrolase n=1 Tax=Streptomyces sp. NPDC048191 TaxID=3155484 RepID=UPI0033C14927
MSLTGTPLFHLLIAATIVCVAATIMFCSRVKGPRPLRWLVRLVMILLCQLTAICVVAVRINNDYGLYASWNDLMGRDTQTAAMPGPAADRAEFTHSTTGVQQTYFRGKQSKLSGQVIVWTPPQYDQPRYRHDRFPVVLLLHGVPGSPESWVDQGGMPQDFRQLMKAGTTHPFILAMPVIDPGGINTDCTNQAGTNVGTWLARDVPHLLGHAFRTLPGSKSWAVMGFSTGGFCAARLPLAYPKVFGTGAALDPDPLTGDPDVITNPQVRKRTSPTHMVAHTTAPVNLFLATSAQDRFSPPRCLQQFTKAAAGTRVRTQTMVLPTGGHNYNTWARLYPAAFAFLSRHTTAPKQ